MTSGRHKQSTLNFELSNVEPTVHGPVECLGMTFPNDEERRKYFLGILREKLKDPEFRKIEGFPVGSDEDILALSDPPYYTACPNPFIADFIKHYGKPYDPATDGYRREPFAVDVSEGKTDPIYNAHSYHTKVPHKAIMRYILHYTEPGDIVLDAFCGTGMTGLAAQACGFPEPDFRATIESEMPGVKWGKRRAILDDLSPAATFIARNYNAPPDVRAFAESAAAALSTVRAELGWLYGTNQRGKQAEIYHTVWSDVFICSNCSKDIVFWDAAVDPKTGSISDELTCEACEARFGKRQLEHAQETVYDPATKRTVTRGKQVPVLIKCMHGRRRTAKTPDPSDRELIRRSEEETIPDWHPTTRIDKDIDLWYERNYRPLGIYSVDAFFTRRNLRVLAALWREAHAFPDRSVSLALQFALTGMQVNLSRMNRWRHDVSFPYNPLSGTLYVGSLPVESNVFLGIQNKTERLKKLWASWQQIGDGSIISTGSASDLRGFPPNSVDYIFTDPPFGSNIIYSDLSIIWESWLRVSTNTPVEAVVHRRKKSQPTTLEMYVDLMAACFEEMHRALKPGRWITVEFHNTQNAVWNAIQEALLRAGFVIADVRTLDKQMQTFKQVTAAGAVKQDLVISAYKPNGGLEDRFKLEAGTEEGVWDFVRTHLKQLPVFVSKDGRAEVIAERQNYLLFDRMVAFHVQHSVTVPLSASEFYAGLAQRFSERDGMYFLPEQVAEYNKKRMLVKDIETPEFAPVDEFSAIRWLQNLLKAKPQTFQDIHPQFLRDIGGWQKHEKPLELSELLEQNFLRYDGKGEVSNQIHSYLSTNFKELRNLPKDAPELRAKAKDRWYVPDPNKAGDLEKLRERSLLKEFFEYLPPGYKPVKPDSQEGFIPGLEPKPAPVPKGKKMKVMRLEAVRAGFKQCWQNRDYRTIIAVAQRIPENVLQEDPKLLMWYDQALTRSGGEA